MRKILIVPLLLPVVGFAALKGYYWYQVKEAVDTLADQVAPFGQLTYRSIVADFSGNAGAETVVFQPRGTDLKLAADRVVVAADSWTYFLNGGAIMGQEQLPNSLALRVERLELDLEALSGIATEADQSAEVLGCERAGVSGVPFWKALGYSRLYSNLDIGYRFNPDNGYLNVAVTSDTPALFSVTLESSVATGATQLLPGTLNGFAQLSEVGLKVEDDSYNERRNSFCANLNGENIAAFVNRHADLLAGRYRDQGLQFSDALTDAYRKFLLTKGVIDLRLVAREPVPLVALDPPALSDQFEFRLKVNGERVAPVEFSWFAPTDQAALAGLMKAADQQESSVAPVSEASPSTGSSTESSAGGEQQSSGRADNPYQLTAVKRKPKPVFRVVEVSQLPAYIGESMQVDTLNGHRIEGTLDSVIRNQLRVKQELEGGEAILPIRFDLIRVVRILQ